MKKCFSKIAPLQKQIDVLEAEKAKLEAENKLKAKKFPNDDADIATVKKCLETLACAEKVSKDPIVQGYKELKDEKEDLKKTLDDLVAKRKPITDQQAIIEEACKKIAEIEAQRKIEEDIEKSLYDALIKLCLAIYKVDTKAIT